MLNMADLFENPMILLDLPVLIMEMDKGRSIKRRERLRVGQVNRIMARLVSWFAHLRSHFRESGNF